MIRPLLEDEAWCYWVVSMGALLSFLGFIAACICSCRRNENKTTTANRSLPDIPKDKNGGHENRGESVPQDIYETTETIGDHSELYATVQDTVPEEQISEREPQEITQQNSLTAESTTHQYTRFSSPSSDNVEHPYAQLQNVQKTDASQQNRNSITPTASTEKPSTSGAQGNPIAPPRSRRSSSHNSLLSQEISADIQAANAITGGVQANQDLPYMTPPLLMLHPHPPQTNSPQQHFSGDSQDSKGYTSISVREPLANIIAQTKTAYRHNQGSRPLTDPHYATVSDDSDEMYAAIDEQDKVYTSGSETYAQIQPMTAEIQRVQQNEQAVFCQSPSRVEEPHLAPQPPSVDSLRHVAHAHSRQASSSSANSSIVNPGSPKPEKRQANSPLPPPPEGTSDVYASVEKRPKSDDRSRSSMSMGKSLEDMYAKVMKKKKDVEEQPDAHTNCNSNMQSDSASCRKLSLVDMNRASWSSHESSETQGKKELEAVHYIPSTNSVINFHIETETTCVKLSRTGDVEINISSLEIDHGYEAVNSNLKKSPASRTTSNLDPNYETLRPQCSRDTDYQTTAVVPCNNTEIPSATYSVPFKQRQVSNASSEDPGYEKVRLRRRVDLDQDTDSEPNYESMPHDSGEPNYASVCRPGDSDTDPNYESVGHSDPNYESVKYMSVHHPQYEPPYEQVNNYKPPLDLVGYEKVKIKKAFNTDYEKINLNHSSEQMSNGDTDDEQYVQV